MGVKDFTSPYSRTNGPIADSLYVPDIIINPHKRFAYVLLFTIFIYVIKFLFLVL